MIRVRLIKVLEQVNMIYNIVLNISPYDTCYMTSQLGKTCWYPHRATLYSGHPAQRPPAGQATPATANSWAPDSASCCWVGRPGTQ